MRQPVVLAQRCMAVAPTAGESKRFMSIDAQTAIAEYQQLSPLMPPGTLVGFEISVGPVVDFTAGYSTDEWDPLWNDFYSDWRNLWFDKKVEPPSWVLGDMAIAAGAKGILFKSRTRSAGVNLVLYPSTLVADDVFQVYDLANALPKNADSWR